MRALPDAALQVLSESRREHAALTLATGERFEEVLTSSRGESWHPDRLSAAWTRDAKRTVEANVVPFKMTLHDCRHCYGSHLVAVGTDLRTVSEMMGHADPSFTLRTYAHSDSGRKKHCGSGTRSARLSLRLCELMARWWHIDARTRRRFGRLGGCAFTDISPVPGAGLEPARS